ncbi:ABC transporter permease [Amorphus sp. MBR-141]
MSDSTIPTRKPVSPGWTRLPLFLFRVGEALLYFSALVLFWELMIRVFDVPSYVFPAPMAVAWELFNGISSGLYLYNLKVTMTAVLSGFALGSLTGLLLGISITTFPVVERVLYPYVVALQTMPKVALAPLMIVWFGFGIQSKIVLVSIACMFPVLINTIAGIRSADNDRISMVRALGGSRLQILRYILLPSSLPFIFAGLNTGIVLAVITAIVGEFVGARTGIGVLILQANFSLDLARVFSLIAVLSISGIILSTTLRYLDRRICFWAGKSSR